ncbi:MAG: DUF3365 domain-containing protein [Archangiaceae bacterium]|nr:DUF3365 domain-containing protein [Archangiaceae bacterium]
MSLVLLAACARAAPVPATREQLPAEAARADRAISALRARLMTRLTEAVGQGGPARAIDVCSTEAPALAAQVGHEQGVEVGRTSFRLRNGQNAPRPWARATVEAGEGRKAAASSEAVFDLGDRVGVLAPIPVAPLCLGCHGPTQALAPDVSAALAARYPGDRAVGFAEGDLRGFFWAEVPKQ